MVDKYNGIMLKLRLRAPHAQRAVLCKQQHRAERAAVRVRVRGERAQVAPQLRLVLARDARVVGLELEHDAVVDLKVDDARLHDVPVDDLAHVGLPPHRDSRVVEPVADDLLRGRACSVRRAQKPRRRTSTDLVALLAVRRPENL